MHYPVSHGFLIKCTFLRGFQPPRADQMSAPITQFSTQHHTQVLKDTFAMLLSKGLP